MLEKRDALTGLCDRETGKRLVEDYLLEAINSALLIVLDLDDFHVVNETFGDEKGNEILRRTGRTIQEFFRANDVFARLGGNRFMVFAKGCSDTTNMDIRLHAMCDALEMKVEDDEQEGKSCQISASIGVAVADETLRKFDALYAAAEEAMLGVKEHGKGAVSFSHRK